MSLEAVQNAVEHPAKFSSPVLDAIGLILLAEKASLGNPFTVLDPFAGVGRIHELREYGFTTVGVELEPEWAFQSQFTRVGDATKLDLADESVDAVATSPCYGNRLSDHHNARDGSRRVTYRHVLGRPLSPNNAGAMQWGPDYQELHARAWKEAYRVLRPGSPILVNVSNHIRSFKVVPVVEWHLAVLMEIGFYLEKVDRISTQRMRYGANSHLRVPFEHLLFLRKSPV